MIAAFLYGWYLKCCLRLQAGGVLHFALGKCSPLIFCKQCQRLNLSEARLCIVSEPMHVRGGEPVHEPCIQTMRGKSLQRCKQAAVAHRTRVIHHLW